MPTLIHERVREAREGRNGKVICRVGSGWVVMGDVQFLRGYCLLLPDPVVGSLNELDEAGRALFLREMTVLGDALLAVTGARRINYEILGNTEAALHAHVFPRYAEEAAELKGMPAWFYDWKNGVRFDLARDGDLMSEIKAYLVQAGVGVA